MITIVDYGMGNIGSIANMLKYLGSAYQITSNKELIYKAKKLILPGVGSFDYGMNKIKDLDLLSVLNDKALKEKIPILGICLGMQLMTNGSEEGSKKGLGWIDAFTYKFPIEKGFKIPNMGWSYIEQEKESSLFKLEDVDTRFYFVHSYYVKCNNKNDSLFKAEYVIKYTCGFEKDNIFGVQFHPEKSHKYGKKLFENFIEL